MGIPDLLEKKHVLIALEQLDAGVVCKWGASRKYLLHYEGKSYPPKAALGLAICIAKRTKEESVEFSGGERTNQALRRLGFSIISKGSINS